MKFKFVLLVISCWMLVMGLLGCTVRTYKMTKERKDLDLEGNRGYLEGKPPLLKEELKKTRTINVLEIEIGQPVKIE